MAYRMHMSPTSECTIFPRPSACLSSSWVSKLLPPTRTQPARNSPASYTFAHMWLMRSYSFSAKAFGNTESLNHVQGDSLGFSSSSRCCCDEATYEAETCEFGSCALCFWAAFFCSIFQPPFAMRGLLSTSTIWSRRSSLYRPDMMERPTGMPCSPVKAGTWTTGVWRPYEGNERGSRARSG